MRIRFRIFDRETKKIIPARIILKKGSRSILNHYTEWEGIYTEGEETYDIPAGKYSINIKAGNEYKETEKQITIKEDKTEYNFYLSRILNMEETGWWCGEGHTHIYRGDNEVNYRQIYLIMKAEGFNYILIGAPVNNKEEQLIKELRNSEHKKNILNAFIKNRKKVLLELKKYRKKGFYFLNGMETPKCRFGHIWWFNFPLKTNPVKYWDEEYDKWQNSGAKRKEPYPAFFNYEAIKKIKEASKKALAIYAHPVSWWFQGKNFITNISAELIFDTIAGPVYDGLSIMSYDTDNKYSQQLWYYILNMGYKIPGFSEMDACFGHSTKFSKHIFKTYIYTGSKKFNYKKITKSAKKGQSFMTSGPLLFLKVNRKLPGTVFKIKKKTTFNFEITAIASGFIKEKIKKVELIKNGKIINTWTNNKISFHKNLEQSIISSCWYTVKCYGNSPEQVAISNPVYFEAEKKDLIKTVLLTIKNKKNDVLIIENNKKKKKIKIKKNTCRINIPITASVKILRRKKIILNKRIIEFPQILKNLQFLYKGEFLQRDKRLKPGEIPLKYFTLLSELPEIEI